MSLDDLLSTVRANAVLGGPLAVSVKLRKAGDLDDGTEDLGPIQAVLSPASAQLQMLQGQGVVEGRFATGMLTESEVQTLLGRSLQEGDEIIVSSGTYVGEWSCRNGGNAVRGGWWRCDLRLERMLRATSAQEVRG